MYRLHCFCQSGNSFKVAMMLDALGASWEPVFVDYMKGATKSPDWRRAFNEMGEVPVLEDGDCVLSQSGMILHHLAEKHGQFGGTTPSERREVLRWIMFDNHKFSSYFVSYRFLKSFVPTPPNPEVMAWLKGRIDASFAIVEQHLAQKHFVAADRLTIADFSMSGYLFFPAEESGYILEQTHPNITAWLARIRERPGWRGPYDVLPGQRILPYH